MTQPSSGSLPFPAPGERRFGRINWLGFWTLLSKEVRRFLKVYMQTVVAPVMTAALFLAVFALALGARRGDVGDIPFATFLAPGIVMMAVIQNAFANSSSSIIVAKVQGNIVDTLMPPLSGAELVVGYISGAVARGFLVAVVIAVGAALFLDVGMQNPLWVVVFVFLGSVLMGGLGLIAGIFANKFDQLAAISNFLITPLAFLSGTFYSIDALPRILQILSHINPFFYVIDGVRYGMIGVSDSSPFIGLAVVGLACAAVVGLCWRWMSRGYRLKS